LCGQSHGFNLQNATRVAANDKDSRERLCCYILRPPVANDRLKWRGEAPWGRGRVGSHLLPGIAFILALLAHNGISLVSF
jgi:hypothetical protein